MADHFHTAEDQPWDLRKHLRDHGVPMDEDPRRGDNVTHSAGLAWLHLQQHPDHDVVRPSLFVVKREMTTEQAALLYLKLEIAATATGTE